MILFICKSFYRKGIKIYWRSFKQSP